VDRDLSLSVFVLRRDGDLQVYCSCLSEDQGCLQGQLGEGLGASLLASLQRHLDEGGAGQDRGAEDGVVCQPGVSGEGDAPGE
jgi:hypothetical protein